MSCTNVAFADLTPIDESTLIERSQLLDAIADDDGIEWKTDPFEMRPEMKSSPDEITAGYHQTPLDPASLVLTAFMAAGGLYQWTRVVMGLKGSGPYFQRSMQNTVLNGLV